jgi:tRNA 2-thiouridine synthesizing protein D
MGRMLILLCESPFQYESVENAVNIAETALSKGHKVDISLMMDGVYNPLTSQSGVPFNMESISDRFKRLIELGADVTACRVCAELRGVTEEMIPEGMEIGGIFDFSESVMEADIILSFTGAT